MAEEQAGFFLVPTEHLAEMHEIDEESNRATLEFPHDFRYRIYRVFGRAQELAVAATVLDLPDHPKALDGYYAHLRWVKECLADGKRDQEVFDPDDVAVIQAHVEREGFRGLVAHMKANKARSRRIPKEVLRPYYDGLEGLLRSVRPGVHGLVISSFDPEHRDPPPPPPPPPPPREEPRTPEEIADGQSFVAYLERIVRNSRRQGLLPWWTELTSEGRVLLGYLSAEVGPGWRDLYEDANDTTSGRVQWARLRRFSDAIELALENGLEESSAGMVYAMACIRNTLRSREPEIVTAVYTPDEVREFRRRLDEVLAEHGGKRGFLRWLKNEAPNWKIAIPRAALATVREHLDRAVETGSWLVWLHDIYDWPGES